LKPLHIDDDDDDSDRTIKQRLSQSVRAHILFTHVELDNFDLTLLTIQHELSKCNTCIGVCGVLRYNRTVYEFMI